MKNRGVGSWPQRRARMTPHRTAAISDSGSLTYAELQHRVERLAQAMHGLGIKPGDRIAYLGPNDPAFLETLFAAGAVGAIFVPLNTRLAPAELAYMLNDAGAVLLVSSPAHAPSVDALPDTPALHHRLALGEEYEAALAAAGPGPAPDVPVDLDDVCMIMYTSGTTGQPKGAMLTHGNLTWNCYNLLIDLDLTNTEVALIDAPLFHTAALNHTALPVFLKGGTNVLVRKFNVDTSFDLIAEHRVTLMFGVPAMYQQLALSPRWASADLSSLRILHCGGAPVPEPLIRTYQQRHLTFVQGYGMTEASPGTMVLRPEDSVTKIGSAGVPHFFTDVTLLRTSDADATRPGEVLVQGPNVMKGYWGRPSDTASTVTDGWLHTGDAAITDDDGYFYIVERIKDMIISGGENIYPAEVENVLYEHPAVAECVVIGVADERWGEVGRAIVVLRDDAHAAPDEILAFLTERLARYKIPRSLVTVDVLPRTASGKIRRAEARRHFGTQEQGTIR